MPHLAQGDSCRVVRQAPNIDINLYTTAGGPAALRVCSPDPSVDPVIHERRNGVLTTYTGPLEIRTFPPRGGQFPHGTLVQFEVVVGPETWLGPEVDISALPEVILGRLAPAPDARDVTEIQALKIDEITAAELVSPITFASQYQARSLAYEGLALRAPAGLALCLDSSASMAPHARSGLLQILVEVALGVDRGLGDGSGLPVVAVDNAASALPDLTVKSADGYVTRYFAQRANATGFRPTRSLQEPPFAARDYLVVLITDAWNSELAEQLERLRAALPGQRWRPLLLGGQLQTPEGIGFGQLVGPDLEVSVAQLTTEPGHQSVLTRFISQMVGTRETGSQP